MHFRIQLNYLGCITIFWYKIIHLHSGCLKLAPDICTLFIFVPMSSDLSPYPVAEAIILCNFMHCWLKHNFVFKKFTSHLIPRIIKWHFFACPNWITNSLGTKFYLVEILLNRTKRMMLLCSHCMCSMTWGSRWYKYVQTVSPFFKKTGRCVRTGKFPFST